jgi:hypothetical protein
MREDQGMVRCSSTVVEMHDEHDVACRQIHGVRPSVSSEQVWGRLVDSA